MIALLYSKRCSPRSLVREIAIARDGVVLAVEETRSVRRIGGAEVETFGLEVTIADDATAAEKIEIDRAVRANVPSASAPSPTSPRTREPRVL